MSRYLPYSPEQVELLPASVHEVLGGDHLCFFVHRVVEQLELKRFHAAYASEGGQLYHPSLMLKVWLYGYALGITSSRRLAQRLHEDLALRYLAGGAQPEYWSLNQFRRRHGLAINDCFTQVVELAARMGLRQLGTVAIEATRIKASASPDKVVVDKREQRARIRRKVRRWQQACEADDSNQGAGSHLGIALDAAEITAELEPLARPRRRSTTDPDARFLRSRGGRFLLGYSAEIAVSEDHLIVAQRVTQAGHENHSLEPMLGLIAATCGSVPRCLGAGLQPGPRTQPRPARSRPGQPLPRSPARAHAGKDALARGQANLSQTQGHRRTRLRHAQGAAQPTRLGVCAD